MIRDGLRRISTEHQVAPNAEVETYRSNFGLHAKARQARSICTGTTDMPHEHREEVALLKSKTLSVLTFNRYYLPGYRAGGPIRTLANMVERLGDGIEFRIVTMDRDVSDAAAYPGVDLNQWNRVGKAQVWYASPDRRAMMQMAHLMRNTPHHVLYLNSFLDPVFTLRVLLARRLGLIPRKPVIVAPRGEFSPGAWGLKTWKKRIYLRGSRALELFDDVIWQASSELEAQDVIRTFKGGPRIPDRRIVVAPDIAPECSLKGPAASLSQRPMGEPLRVCFLSRIAPMKNLDYALAVLAMMPRTVTVRFEIYGPIESVPYWSKCRELIDTLPPNVSVRQHGPVEPEDVVSTLSEHDLLFLPTRGENYGHVIHEAMRAGLPILISDKTPWQRLEEKGVGWALPLEAPDRFVDVIQRVAAWTEQQRFECGERARDYAFEFAENGGALSSTARMFASAASTENSVALGGVS